MHRIATAMLIAAAVVALNAGMLREAFAASAVAAPDAPTVTQAGSTRLISLLVVLESLRQAPLATTGKKV